MTQSLEFDKIRDFIRLFHYQYSEETLLPEVCDVTLFQEKFSERYGTIGNWEFPSRDRGHSGLEFNQIGQRSLTPIEILNSEHPLDVIQSYVRSLRLGERHYVLNQLNQKAENNDIETISFDEPTHVSFQEWCSQVRKPDHLFLPLDTEFYNTVFDWRQRNDYNLDIGEVAISGRSVVNIHWVPLSSGIKHGYLISSEGLDIVQKWFGDSPDPSGFSYDSQYNILSENRPLMAYIGDEIVEDEEEDTESFREKVDFLYRIVVSELIVESNHAVRLQPTKSLSND
ncbi:hypothetical protein C5B86_02145 [Haloferax sp. Atlit-19N]|uniref:hypothetical protein n=1 Tax=Haloferax sp. Atlit-19N TaxID=2077201 RepID=UPI000E24A3E9|nr:hypothetical protein [Haloferax sp. Atlit-19N]RDZ47882.1 hypothetical protein C5B86_02145 [Haloferax sp. Atlit-19N]